MREITGLDMIKEYLISNGYDGLYGDDNECGCTIDNLIPCFENGTSCQPGYLQNCDSDCECEGDSCLGPEKPKEIIVESKTLNVKKIVRVYIINCKYVGLFNNDRDCRCMDDLLMVCSSYTGNCKPGVWNESVTKLVRKEDRQSDDGTD